MSSKKATKKHRYSEDDKANALVALTANGGNVSKTANQLGIPAATLRKWRDGHVHPEVTQKCEVKKKELAEKLEELAHRCVDLLPDKLPEASVRDLAGALIVAVDKMQLLKGEPTNINREVSLTPEQKQKAAEVRERLSLVKKAS